MQALKAQLDKERFCSDNNNNDNEIIYTIIFFLDSSCRTLVYWDSCCTIVEACRLGTKCRYSLFILCASLPSGLCTLLSCVWRENWRLYSMQFYLFWIFFRADHTAFVARIEAKEISCYRIFSFCGSAHDR